MDSSSTHEVIVRIAQPAGSPGTAERVLAARICGDRFALMLRSFDTAVARQLAANLHAARRLTGYRTTRGAREDLHQLRVSQRWFTCPKV
jgi:GGDEF domain-containing protein